MIIGHASGHAADAVSKKCPSALSLVGNAVLEDLLILRSERGLLSMPPRLGLIMRGACRRQCRYWFAGVPSTAVRRYPPCPLPFNQGISIFLLLDSADDHHKGCHFNCTGQLW